MTASGIFIGVDVAKRELEVAERPSGVRWSVRNDVAGVAGLVERLREAKVTLIVVEPTGGYETPVVAAMRNPVVATGTTADEIAARGRRRPTPISRRSNTRMDPNSVAMPRTCARLTIAYVHGPDSRMKWPSADVCIHAAKLYTRYVRSG